MRSGKSGKIEFVHPTGQRILMVAGLDIRVLDENGELIGTLKRDESRIYQPSKRV